MRDFPAYVRQQLPPLEVGDERRAKIVEELALQLEEHYASLLHRGASDEEAWTEVVGQIPSWPALAHNLSANAPPTSVVKSPIVQTAWLRSLLTAGWVDDVRLSLRLLRRDRGFTATAVITLAVCLAANGAIFAVVNQILLNPLRVPEPDRILIMANQYRLVGATGISTTSARPDYFDRLEHVKVFEEQSMHGFTGETVQLEGIPSRITGMVATPSLFRLLRVAPAYGRIFTDIEGEQGHANKVILSHGLWQEVYGGDTGIVGRDVRFTGRPFTVVGIMPRNFSFGGPEVRFWVPLTFTDLQKSDDARHNNGLFSIGRLKPGATIEQVREQLRALDAANWGRFPQWREMLANTGFYTSVEPYRDVLVRPVKGRLYLLWGGAAFVLLIGVVNVANLAVARSTLRTKELATRLAIGGRRAQIARQLLVEGLLLACASGVAALAVGRLILSAFVETGLISVRGATEVQLDAIAAGLTMGASVVIGLVVGVIFALPLFTVRLQAILQTDNRTGTSARTARLMRRVLIVAQVACSFVLLLGASLLLVSFRNLLALDAGFKTDGVVTASTSLPRVRYETDDRAHDFGDRALGAIRAIPGVAAAGATTMVPLAGNYNSTPIVAEGYVPKAGESLVSAVRVTVTPGYFEAIGTPLVRGRYFEEPDNQPNANVIVLDERLARRFWPNGDPIGRRVYRPTSPKELLSVGPATRWLTVVGVVQEAKLRDLLPAVDNFGGTYYLPFAAIAPRDYGFVVRSDLDNVALMRVVRAALAQIDPEVPLFDIRTLSERAELSLMPRKSVMLIASFFGAVALLLSAVGIYGVLAYLVTQRAREMGIRMALGSTPRGIFRLVLNEGLLLLSGGVGLGLLGSVALRGALETQLYGVRAMNPPVMILVALALALIALTASVSPARRAARVDLAGLLNSQ